MAKDSDRYKVANCTQAQPVVGGLARVAHGKVISVSVLTNLERLVVDGVGHCADSTTRGLNYGGPG